MNELNELNTTVDEMETLEIDYAPEALDEPYKPVHQLYIPDEARELYESKGFDLQWVRIYVPNTQGQIDKKNVQQKEGDQYTFVLRSEVPGLTKAMVGFFGQELADESSELYIVGDLALAKFPLARKASKKRYNEQRMQSRSKAIVHDLRKNDLSPDKSAGEKFETVRQQPQGPRGNVEFGD